MWGAVYIVIMVGLFAASIRKPYFAYVALLSMFGIEQWGMLYIPYLLQHQTFTNIAVFIILAFAIVVKPPSFSFRAGNHKIRLWGLLLIAYAYASHIWAPIEAHSWIYWKATWPYLISSIFLATIVIKSVNDMENAYKWFVWVGGFLLILFAFIPEWQNRHIIISGNYNVGTKLALPLTLAQLSGYVLIAVLINYKKNIMNTLVVAAVLVGVLVVMLKSGSRGPMVFSILAIVMVAPRVWGRGVFNKIIPVAIITAILIFVIDVVLSDVNTFSSRWSFESMTNDMVGRLNMSMILLVEAYKSPMTILFGLGNSASFSPLIIGSYPHIVPLEILAEEGIIGFIIFSIFSYKVFIYGRKMLKNRAIDMQEKKVLATTYACWLFTIFLCFKQGSLITSPNIFLFAIMCERLYVITKLNIKARETA